jgi:hypothetical protein
MVPRVGNLENASRQGKRLRRLPAIDSVFGMGEEAFQIIVQ